MSSGSRFWLVAWFVARSPLNTFRPSLDVRDICEHTKSTPAPCLYRVRVLWYSIGTLSRRGRGSSRRVLIPHGLIVHNPYNSSFLHACLLEYNLYTTWYIVPGTRVFEHGRSTILVHTYLTSKNHSLFVVLGVLCKVLRTFRRKCTMHTVLEDFRNCMYAYRYRYQKI